MEVKKMIEKITCPNCGEKVNVDEVNKRTVEIVRQNVTHFLGIEGVNEAIESNEGDCYFYCSECDEKFDIKDTPEFKEANPEYRNSVL